MNAPEDSEQLARELADAQELEDDMMLAAVCPGCLAFGPEPCAPGCIDAAIRRKAEDEQLYGHGGTDDDDDEGGSEP